MTKTSTTSKRNSAPATSCANGMVASTIGTAPRSPAQERNTWWRTGILNHDAQATTRQGGRRRQEKARRTAIRAARSVTRSGKASSPSMTNRPIWAIQPIPSTKERVAARCGSWAFPRIRAHVHGRETAGVDERGDAVREDRPDQD